MHRNAQGREPDRIGVPSGDDDDPDRNMKLLSGEQSVWAIYGAIADYIHT
jgi:hypothetical protein